MQFDEATMAGLGKQNLTRFLVEFDQSGNVMRELGLGIDGRVAHRFPGAPTLDGYGIMGSYVIHIAGENPSDRAIILNASDLGPLNSFEEHWASD